MESKRFIIASNCDKIWTVLSPIALRICRVAAEGLEGAVAQLLFDPTPLRILRCSIEIEQHLSRWMLRIKLEMLRAQERAKL
jgi:hypothetical protein